LAYRHDWAAAADILAAAAADILAAAAGIPAPVAVIQVVVVGKSLQVKAGSYLWLQYSLSL
jgi:hypothetical protein